MAWPGASTAFPAANATLGQICVVGSNPCQSLTSGDATQADYLAPGAIPAPNPVSVTVISASNPSLTASAQITVINHVLVSVLPSTVNLPPLGVQGFTASVLGTDNQNVVWQIQGTGCTSSGLCGSITPAGTYTAPAAAPTPDALTVVAISQDDTSQSGSAKRHHLQRPKHTVAASRKRLCRRGRWLHGERGRQ